MCLLKKKKKKNVPLVDSVQLDLALLDILTIHIFLLECLDHSYLM